MQQGYVRVGGLDERIGFEITGRDDGESAPRMDQCRAVIQFISGRVVEWNTRAAILHTCRQVNLGFADGLLTTCVQVRVLDQRLGHWRRGAGQQRGFGQLESLRGRISLGLEKLYPGA